MCIVNEDLKSRVWEKGLAVDGYDSQKVRKDACGAWILYDEYGDRDSVFGWEIDHIFPKSVLRDKNVPEDEIDNIDNLRPLNWMNNDSKSSDYPEYQGSVVADDNKNKRQKDTFVINSNVQQIIQRLFGKYSI